ncbi:MAG: molybdate ABC transporter permease subunit [Rhodospirillaceae bacterium]|nr:molybdate ABC transporter permease subunit [Rhodospirillaceae bacterium]
MELSEIESEAIWLSLKVSIWAVAFSIPFALGCAWLLARREFIGKNILNGIIHLPLVLPPVVMGYLLLVSFGTKGFPGALLKEWFNLTFIFSWRGAALAAAVVSFPLMVRTMRLSYEAMDEKLEAAALTLGATPFRVFFTVTLPLIMPGVLAGCILAFARCLGEFGATITFVSNIPGETRTIPIAIFNLIQQPEGTALAMRLVIISLVLAMVALVGAEMMNKKLSKILNG